MQIKVCSELKLFMYVKLTAINIYLVNTFIILKSTA